MAKQTPERRIQLGPGKWGAISARHISTPGKDGWVTVDADHSESPAAPNYRINWNAKDAYTDFITHTVADLSARIQMPARKGPDSDADVANLQKLYQKKNWTTEDRAAWQTSLGKVVSDSLKKQQGLGEYRSEGFNLTRGQIEGKEESAIRKNILNDIISDMAAGTKKIEFDCEAMSITKAMILQMTEDRVLKREKGEKSPADYYYTVGKAYTALDVILDSKNEGGHAFITIIKDDRVRGIIEATAGGENETAYGSQVYCPVDHEYTLDDFKKSRPLLLAKDGVPVVYNPGMNITKDLASLCESEIRETPQKYPALGTVLAQQLAYWINAKSEYLNKNKSPFLSLDSDLNLGSETEKILSLLEVYPADAAGNSALASSRDRLAATLIESIGRQAENFKTQIKQDPEKPRLSESNVLRYTREARDDGHAALLKNHAKILDENNSQKVKKALDEMGQTIGPTLVEQMIIRGEEHIRDLVYTHGHAIKTGKNPGDFFPREIARYQNSIIEFLNSNPDMIPLADRKKIEGEFGKVGQVITEFCDTYKLPHPERTPLKEITPPEPKPDPESEQDKPLTRTVSASGADPFLAEAGKITPAFMQAASGMPASYTPAPAKSEPASPTPEKLQA